VVRSWTLVMLVTFTETYLQDVLAYCAGLDPSVMNDSQQAATFADIDAVGSLDELRAALRSRWAANWLRDEGPTRWIAKLVKKGAPGYEAGCAVAMEELWGIRNVIVHRAGVVDLAFQRNHPTVGYKLGQRIGVTDEQLKRYIEGVKHFIEPTDQFFAKRFAHLTASAAV
jgi:hypothetical protein